MTEAQNNGVKCILSNTCPNVLTSELSLVSSASLPFLRPHHYLCPPSSIAEVERGVSGDANKAAVASHRDRGHRQRPLVPLQAPRLVADVPVPLGVVAPLQGAVHEEDARPRPAQAVRHELCPGSLR